MFFLRSLCQDSTCILAACPRTSDAAGESAMASSSYWWSLLCVLVVDSLDFNFLGFYMNYNKEAKSLAFGWGPEVSQVQSLSLYREVLQSEGRPSRPRPLKPR